jgi:hypothetical protein
VPPRSGVPAILSGGRPDLHPRRPARRGPEGSRRSPAGGPPRRRDPPAGSPPPARPRAPVDGRREVVDQEVGCRSAGRRRLRPSEGSSSYRIRPTPPGAPSSPPAPPKGGRPVSSAVACRPGLRRGLRPLAGERRARVRACPSPSAPPASRSPGRVPGDRRAGAAPALWRRSSSSGLRVGPARSRAHRRGRDTRRPSLPCRTRTSERRSPCRRVQSTLVASPIGRPARRLLDRARSRVLGDVAQLEERLLCTQEVVGSSPIVSTV